MVHVRRAWLLVYGFTYFTLFALAQREYDPSKDLMASEKVNAIAHFQQKCYFAGGRTISFSDGDSRGTYPMGLTCCLADQYSDISFSRYNYMRKSLMETAVGDGLAFTGTGIGHIAIWTMYRIKRQKSQSL